MARPRERAFLNELAADQNLERVMGDQQKRMVAHEPVLRFMAFLLLDYQKSPKNIASFLDEAAERLKTASDEELSVLARRFRTAVEIAWRLFGQGAFEKKSSGEGFRRRKNSALFEVWTVSLARLAQSDPEGVECLLQRKEEVERRLAELISDDQIFCQASSMSTQKRDHVITRFDYVAKIISEVCGA